MEKNNWMSQFLQWVSTATAVLVPISQFIFKDQFELFFTSDTKLFTAASIVSFVLSVVVILALYSNRYLILFKFYPSKKAKEEYFKYLRSVNNPVANQNTDQSNQKSDVVTSSREDVGYVLRSMAGKHI